MEYRKLGSTGFEVSEIAFGGGAVSGEGGGYGFGHISEAASEEILHLAFDKGINLFDTAPIYGFGLSEERFGRYLKKIRDKVFIISKSGVGWHDNKRVNMSNDPQQTEQMLEDSRRRLQFDVIDLFMIHWPDKNVDIRRPMEVLSKAKAQGKIKHIGLCNTHLEDLKKAEEVGKIEVVQSEFNFFDDFLSTDLFPYLEEQNIGFMSWGTLDKGVIAGTHKESNKYDEADSRSKAPWWKEQKERRKKRIEFIENELRGKSFNGTQLALNHNLSFPKLSTCLCGPKTPDRLEALLTAYQNPPTASEYEELLEKRNVSFN